MLTAAPRISQAIRAKRRLWLGRLSGAVVASRQRRCSPDARGERERAFMRSFPHTWTTDAHLPGCVLFVSGCILRLNGSGSYGSTGESLVPLVGGGGGTFFPISP